jgi:hypothetical protein
MRIRIRNPELGNTYRNITNGAAGGQRPHGRHYLTWGLQPGGPWQRRGGDPMGGTILPGACSLEVPGSGGRAARGRSHGRHHLTWDRQPGGPRERRSGGGGGAAQYGRHHLTWGRQPGGPWEQRAGGVEAAPWAGPSYLGPAAWRPLGAAGGRRGGGPMGGTILPPSSCFCSTDILSQLRCQSCVCVPVYICSVAQLPMKVIIQYLFQKGRSRV